MLSLHFMTQGRLWEGKFSYLSKNLENVAPKRPRPKLFVNKNAIKSKFGNYANTVGNFQIGWERLREFGHRAWKFLRFGSSHTGSRTSGTSLDETWKWNQGESWDIMKQPKGREAGYILMRGVFSVGGRLSLMVMRNTVMERSAEIPSVTFSPDSDGT